ncbi:MAG: DUF393 domain-containing protein [Verrucomicrobia bacterium]|jgi:predicted DCC family thiol-disulfide oxidoreductase YuxK|nr:DUF393 domain-containing protein [Verrucomicrobiota bacterium]
MSMNQVFYDGKNAFCRHVAESIKKLDKKDQFRFSSLEGKKARALFIGNYAFLRSKKSIVFLEGERVWVKANAVFRLFWLLGGPWKILGSLFVLPGFLTNPIYYLGTVLVRR